MPGWIKDAAASYSKGSPKRLRPANIFASQPTMKPVPCVQMSLAARSSAFPRRSITAFSGAPSDGERQGLPTLPLFRRDIDSVFVDRDFLPLPQKVSHCHADFRSDLRHILCQRQGRGGMRQYEVRDVIVLEQSQPQNLHRACKLPCRVRVEFSRRGRDTGHSLETCTIVNA